MATVDELQWRLTLLQYELVEAVVAHDWPKTRELNSKIVAKQIEIRAHDCEIESLTAQFLAKAKVNRGQ